MEAKLFTSVVYGATIKSETRPLAAFQAAAQATGTESFWFGETAEEKAAISSFFEMDKKNETLLFTDLNILLGKSSFIALPSRETAADLVVYSWFCTRKFDESFQKVNPNFCRWMNHMQDFVARMTGNPQLFHFRISGLKTSFVGATPSSVKEAAPKPTEDKPTEMKKEDVKPQESKKEDKKEEPKVEKKKKQEGGEGNDKKVGVEEEEEPKKKKEKAPKPAPAVEEPVFLPNLLDVRVGKILSAKKHEAADKLFVEVIDVGEKDEQGQPIHRTICSGLAPFYASANEIEGKNVLIVCNLKPRPFQGIESNGMVLAATNADKTTGAVIEASSTSVPGERVTYSSAPAPGKAAEPNQVAKKKILETVSAGWTTDENGNVKWTDPETKSSHTMTAGNAPCTCSLKNVHVG